MKRELTHCLVEIQHPADRSGQFLRFRPAPQPSCCSLEGFSFSFSTFSKRCERSRANTTQRVKLIILFFFFFYSSFSAPSLQMSSFHFLITVFEGFLYNGIRNSGCILFYFCGWFLVHYQHPGISFAKLSRKWP